MKTYSKIVLAGGTGQIGTALQKHFIHLAEEVIVLTRGESRKVDNIQFLNWDGRTVGDWKEALRNTNVVVNLAGKNVNCRYTKENRREIFDSRTGSIEALAGAFSAIGEEPLAWIQLASSTIYRHAEDRPQTEANGEEGSGFSVEVCRKWESTLWNETRAFGHMKKVILRTSLVLSKGDGVYPRLVKMATFGLGGFQGNGKQWVSWIHEDDVTGAIDWILSHTRLEGIFNLTAPEPMTNQDFMKELRISLNSGLGLPAPAWLLDLGAFIIRTEPELVLKSRWVLPERLLNSGFEFRFPDAGSAFRNLRG